ncbi:MAG: hypothetical protein QXV73_05940 [Candidatus Micrarchaeia archaeon]
MNNKNKFQKQDIILSVRKEEFDSFVLEYAEVMTLISYKDENHRDHITTQYGYKFIKLECSPTIIIWGNDFMTLSKFVAILQSFLKGLIPTKEEIYLTEGVHIRRREYNKQQYLEILSIQYDYDPIEGPEKTKVEKQVIARIDKIETQQLLIYLNKIISKILL